MLRNYFLVAVRNLTRNKFFSAINIFGLAIGMTLCMAIIMLVADQMNYDRFNTERNRIFRVNAYRVDDKGNDMGNVDNATSPMPLKDELLENYTGIEKAVRLKRGFGNNWLEVENQNVNIPVKGFFADVGTIEFFQFKLEYGDPTTALAKPYSVVLTRQAADKLFKEENPIGQTFKVGDIGTYTVTGILKETEEKSHLVFEALASMSTVKSLVNEKKIGEDALNNWMNFWDGWTYVLLEEGKTRNELETVFDKIYEQHIASVVNPDAYKAKFRLQGLTEITPGPLINNPIGPSLPWVFIYFLGGLAGVVMLTSCFNFTNLSIARSLKRAKEIGVRKVTGAARWQIFIQFISEAVVISFCALTLACLMLVALKPLILELTLARLFKWDLEANYVVFGIFAVLAMVVGFFAGLFPAVVLSGFQPIKVLKNMNSVKLFSRIGLRKALLVTQFTLSLIFILTVIVMFNQLKLFTGKDYGFNMKENIELKLNNTSPDVLKNELLKFSNITSVSGVSHIPSAGTTYGDGFKKNLSEKEWTNLNYFVVDEDYLANMEIQLMEGKFFSKENGPSNKNFVVINEEALKTLHYKSASEAVGEEIMFQRDSSTKVILGVVKDYNHNALMSKIEPMALMYNPEEISLLQIRYSGSYDEAAKTIEKAWSTINPNLKIDYKSIEERIKFYYTTIFGDLVNVLGFVAALAIIISCLGLLGMATYTVETKVKEISIRKVLGSSDQQLIVLLSKGFFSLLLIAVLIGVPAAWFLNNLWLSQMAYRIDFDFTIILSGILVLLILGTITIGSQTLRAAFTNPVDNLKNE